MAELLLSTPGPDDFHNGWDHLLVEWDDTHVVAVFSDRLGSAYTGSVRLISVEGSVLSAGPVTTYFNEATDPESAEWDNCARRVGDMLVLLHAGSFRLFTFALADSQFVLVNVVNLSGTLTNYGGGRFIAWDDDQLLMATCGTNTSTGLQGRLWFMKWTGTTWVFGAPYTDVASFGGRDYMNLAQVVDSARPSVKTAVLGASYSWKTRYLVVTGSYPAAPNVVAQGTLDQGTAKGFATGLDFYYPYQWFSSQYAPDRIIRVIAVMPGTLTPVTSTNPFQHQFDWAYMPLTMSNGTVIENPLVSIGPTMDYYDIAATQTSDGKVWAAYTGSVTRSTSTPEVFRHPVGEPLVVYPTTVDGGPEIQDYFVRSIAAVGAETVAVWMTQDNKQVWVSFTGLPPFEMSGSTRRGGARFWG